MDYQALIIGFGFITVIAYKRTLYKEVNETKENIFQRIETIIFQLLSIDESHPVRNSFTNEFKLKIKENDIKLKFIDKAILRKQAFLNAIFVLLIFTLIIYIILFLIPPCSNSPFCNEMKIYFNIFVLFFIIGIAYYVYAIFNRLDYLLK